MEWKQIAKETLSKKRYEHTVGVVAMATELAMQVECDVDAITQAAWMHDLLKETDVKELKHQAIAFDQRFATAPSAILHGPACAWKYQEQITPTIAEAVAYHSTGLANASIETKIVYLADYISYDRKQPEIVKIRVIALKDFHLGLKMAVDASIQHLINSDKEIFFLTQQFKEDINE